jgi:hypothetical protein
MIFVNRYVGGGMVNRQSKEWKVGGEDGYETGKLGAIILVGNPREMVGTKIETSLELHEFELDVFLLQDEVSGDGEGLEGRDPLSIVPLAMSVGEDHPSSVSPRWVVEGVKGFYKVVVFRVIALRLS